MFEDWKRKRRINKVQPGNGKPLKSFRWWQPLGRSLFYLRREVSAETSRVYAIDVDYFSWDADARLYMDGVQTAKSELPATFPVPGGVIEVATSTVGLSRMHFVSEAGDEQVLQPDRASAEGLRARFGSRYPRWGRAIGWIAIIVLLIGLVIAGPQVLELVTQVDWIAERFGTFTSPFALPAWANTALLVAGLVAALERALTLRSHWLIDAETWWLG
ncbi:MAG: hypothetical protein ACTHZ9_11360 [Leucobacter sp.]